jgi:bacterial/archaeal transporter family protein
MKPWILYAIISMIFAGVTSVIAKTGLDGISGELGLAIRTAMVFVFIAVFTAAVVPRQTLAAVAWSNVGWLSLSAVTTSVSWIFYYKALKEGQVSTIALIDKGSIVVAITLACLILKEQLTARVIGGGLLMIAGILVIARR